MEWISVKEKLPENTQRVLAYCGKTKKYFVGNVTTYRFPDGVD